MSKLVPPATSYSRWLFISLFLSSLEELVRDRLASPAAPGSEGRLLSSINWMCSKIW